mgnify:CR=1 FL=1
MDPAALQPGLVGLVVRDEIDETGVIDSSDAVGDAVGDEVAEATRVEVIITSVAGAPPAMAALATISPVN